MYSVKNMMSDSNSNIDMANSACVYFKEVKQSQLLILAALHLVYNYHTKDLFLP